MMFLTPSERPQARSNAKDGPGMRVRFANGVVHFFPGATQIVADALMRAACPANLLAEAPTLIEYGERVGTAFRTTHVVKASGNVPNSK